MKAALPIISAAGIFDSHEKFHDPVKYPDNSVSHLRTVIEYELELFLRDGGVSHLNGKSYPIKKGDMLIARPGDRRQSTLHFSSYFVHFGVSDREFQKIVDAACGFHSNIDHKKYEPDMADICRTHLSFEYLSDLDASARLVSFFCRLYNDPALAWQRTQESASASLVSRAIEFMRENYAAPITVLDIARHCSLSSSHFYRIFHATVHTTPNAYLTNLRLAAAKSMLASTTLPLSVIASECGFSSQSYFSDCFRKQFGVSPGKFRSSYTYPACTFTPR